MHFKTIGLQGHWAGTVILFRGFVHYVRNFLPYQAVPLSSFTYLAVESLLCAILNSRETVGEAEKQWGRHIRKRIARHVIVSLSWKAISENGLPAKKKCLRKILRKIQQVTLLPFSRTQPMGRTLPCACVYVCPSTDQGAPSFPFPPSPAAPSPEGERRPPRPRAVAPPTPVTPPPPRRKPAEESPPLPAVPSFYALRRRLCFE